MNGCPCPTYAQAAWPALVQGCDESRAPDVLGAAVVVTEWDALVHDRTLLAGRTHVVAADPPYRREHVALLEAAAREGANIHLHYGHDERSSTSKLLRYLVHPRFAMVCTYRALETLRCDEAEPADAELVALAATLAWDEARVTLGPRSALQGSRRTAGTRLGPRIRGRS